MSSKSQTAGSTRPRAAEIVKKARTVAASNPDRRVGPDEIQAIFDKFSVYPDVATYKPVFLDYVTVINPNGSEQPVSPMYCLSIPSALSLAYLLLDQQPTLYLGDPTAFVGGVVYYSQEVPWGDFAINGAQRNMGTLAFYFQGNSGPQGGSIALQNCKTDIAFG